jgi:hypothetical protein
MTSVVPDIFAGVHDALSFESAVQKYFFFQHTPSVSVSVVPGSETKLWDAADTPSVVALLTDHTHELLSNSLQAWLDGLVPTHRFLHVSVCNSFGPASMTDEQMVALTGYIDSVTQKRQQVLGVMLDLLARRRVLQHGVNDQLNKLPQTVASATSSDTFRQSSPTNRSSVESCTICGPGDTDDSTALVPTATPDPAVAQNAAPMDTDEPSATIITTTLVREPEAPEPTSDVPRKKRKRNLAKSEAK